MKKIKVKIGWSGNNFSCVTENEALNGIIIVTNKTIDGLKKDLVSSLQFHIRSCIKDGDNLPEWLKNREYQLDYNLETSALLHSLDDIISRKAISRATGINQMQISHYASGRITPRPKQRERIIKGIHAISRELASVV